MVVSPISKQTKEQVFQKFNGLCAYSGKSLVEYGWQVDHMYPISSRFWYMTDEQRLSLGMTIHHPNDIQNLLPAITIVNHYKRSLNLQGFRHYMLTFHKRLAKLPKKTTVQATERRILYLQKVADIFSITVDQPFSGQFYFETLKTQP